MGERIGSEPRELKFGGEGKAESIARGFAITTLRNPRDSYNFGLGEVILADCFEDGEKVPIVVIANEVGKLKDFTPPQLALDGFFSPEQAAEEMKSWPGYEATTTKSKMQAITFESQGVYESYSQFRQHSMRHESFGSLVHDEDLRRLFFPTICFNLVEKGGKMQDWVNFLTENHLISKLDEKFMLATRIGNIRLFDYYQRYPAALKNLSINPKDKAFNPMILGGLTY